MGDADRLAEEAAVVAERERPAHAGSVPADTVRMGEQDRHPGQPEGQCLNGDVNWIGHVDLALCGGGRTDQHDAVARVPIRETVERERAIGSGGRRERLGHSLERVGDRLELDGPSPERIRDPPAELHGPAGADVVRCGTERDRGWGSGRRRCRGRRRRRYQRAAGGHQPPDEPPPESAHAGRLCVLEDGCGDPRWYACGQSLAVPAAAMTHLPREPLTHPGAR